MTLPRSSSEGTGSPFGFDFYCIVKFGSLDWEGLMFPEVSAHIMGKAIIAQT